MNTQGRKFFFVYNFSAVISAALLLFTIFPDSAYSQRYSHYLKFFQVRQDPFDVSVPEPISQNGLTMAEFTWGRSYQGIGHYNYVEFASSMGNWTVTNNPGYWVYFEDYLVSLTKDEATALFNGASSIKLDVLQRNDIQKMYNQQGGAGQLEYGVLLNPDGTVKLDGSGKAIPSASPEQYESGQTIVIPVSYNQNVPSFATRLFWNLENPTVRKYIAEFAKKRAAAAGTSKIAFDNVMAFQWQVLRFDPRDTGIEPTPQELSAKALRRAVLTDEILAVLKTSGYELLLNGLYDLDPFAVVFQDYLIEKGHFDGIMAENRFNGCAEAISQGDSVCHLSNLVGRSSDYLDWVNRLAGSGKKVLFVSHEMPGMLAVNNPNAYRIWYWVHLVAQDNTYFYINTSGQAPMVHYPFYDEPLGRPIDPQPVWNQNSLSWTRRYEAGTITFTPSKSFDSRGVAIDPPSISFAASSQDGDGDGVADSLDACPKTAFGTKVNSQGCPVPISTNLSSSLTTDFNTADLTNIADLRLGVQGYTEIIFPGATSLLNFNSAIGRHEPVNLDAGVRIGARSVFIDVSLLPMLNKTARITFYNVSFNNPQIKRDGQSCGTSQCKILAYDRNSGTLTIEVSEFSSYAVRSGANYYIIFIVGVLIALAAASFFEMINLVRKRY